jgi:hypothetical protein
MYTDANEPKTLNNIEYLVQFMVFIHKKVEIWSFIKARIRIRSQNSGSRSATLTLTLLVQPTLAHNTSIGITGDPDSVVEIQIWNFSQESDPDLNP